MPVISRAGTTRGGISVEVDFVPRLEILVADFLAMGVQVKSFREPLHAAVRDVAAPAIRRRFADEGPGWEPLAPATIEKKGHDRILFETGELGRVAGQINAWEIGRDQAKMSNIPERGWYHDEGYLNARTGSMVPARPFLYFTSEEEIRIAEVFDNWIAMRLARRGLL